MAGLVSLSIRTLHVFGMVALLGGAAACWYQARCGERPDSLQVRYEWLFWGAVGVMVVTGVGNLGALGAPGPETQWGRVFAVKVALVLALVLGSLVRTLVVARAEDGRPRRFSRRAYGVTTVALVALVVLAEVLAHG